MAFKAFQEELITLRWRRVEAKKGAKSFWNRETGGLSSWGLKKQMKKTKKKTKGSWTEFWKEHTSNNLRNFIIVFTNLAIGWWVIALARTVLGNDCICVWGCSEKRKKRPHYSGGV